MNSNATLAVRLEKQVATAEMEHEYIMKVWPQVMEVVMYLCDEHHIVLLALQGSVLLCSSTDPLISKTHRQCLSLT